jgi:phosphopantothenoylcysteine decarboxylase/phosphopantothenate--cysteine ligase
VAVETAEQMLAAVRANLAWCDVLIMAAAVADWRPRQVSAQKLKKGATAPTLELERTTDILEAVRALKGERLVVGFAAETQQVELEARRKLESKGLDAIVANDVSAPDAGFEVDTNRVILLTAGGGIEAWPLMSKTAVAERLVAWVEAQVR